MYNWNSTDQIDDPAAYAEVYEAFLTHVSRKFGDYYMVEREDGSLEEPHLNANGTVSAHSIFGTGWPEDEPLIFLRERLRDPYNRFGRSNERVFTEAEMKVIRTLSLSDNEVASELKCGHEAVRHLRAPLRQSGQWEAED